MRRKPLWSDNKLRNEVYSSVWGIVGDDDDASQITRNVLALTRTIRDDLQAALERRTQTAMYLLKANGELREELREAGRAADTNAYYAIDLEEKITELRQRVATLEAQLQAASQPERGWIHVAEALPPVWKSVEIRTTGEMSPSYDIDPFQGPFWYATGYKTTHWRPLPAEPQADLPAQGEG